MRKGNKRYSYTLKRKKKKTGSQMTWHTMQRFSKNQQQKPKLMSNHKQITGHKADMQGNCPYTQAMTGFWN